MKLEQSFEVDAPLERVWQTLIDVEHVAPCLPGAAVTGRNDDGSYNGTFTVKIGPTTASYTGRLEMENVDQTAHTATMQAQGTDKRGQGGAKATIYSRVVPTDGSGTRVDVVTDYHITGRLARFGRGGMIEDISERLLREFARRLQSSLVAEGEPAAAAEPAATPATAVMAEPAVAAEPAVTAEPEVPAVTAEPEVPAEPATAVYGQAATSSYGQPVAPEPVAPEPVAPEPVAPQPASPAEAAPAGYSEAAPAAGYAGEPSGVEPSQPSDAGPSGPPAGDMAPPPPPPAPAETPAFGAEASAPPAEPAPPPPPSPGPPPVVTPPPPPSAPPPPPGAGGPGLQHPPQTSEPLQGLSLVGGVVWGRVKRNPAPAAAAGVAVMLLLARRRRKRNVWR